VEDEIDRIVAQWRRVRPDLEPSPTYTLQRIVRADLLQTASFTEVFARFGMTWGEYLVLAALRRAGPPYRMNPTTLFNSVVLSSGAMTNRLDRLAEMGLVRRLPDPNDRRGRLVELTVKGRELVDKAATVHLANEERLLGGMSATDRTKLADLLRKLLLSEPFRALDPLSRAPASTKSRRSLPRKTEDAKRARASSGAKRRKTKGN
jgi:DNA-binding MarR family transcriptional regulator